MPKAIASIILTISMLITGHSSVAEAPKATTTTVAPTTTTTLVATSKMVEWGRVAWCETHGNWAYQGNQFEGGLGILHSNWAYYGGYKFAHHAWLATPQQRVWVAMRIQNGLPTPDQNGTCAAW